MTKKEIVILAVVGIFGLALRLLYLPQGGLTFGYDQARDAYSALEIFSGNLKIQGPSASTPGLFHGVLYYYVLAPVYGFFGGNPYATATWIAVLNILTIIPIYFLGKLLFNPRVGILAALLFAISFDAVQYALWLSNPTPAILSVAIFYLGLAMYIFNKKSMWGLILSSIGLGFSTQFEIFLGYLFAPLIIALSVFKTKPTLREIIIYMGIYLITTSTMILSYVKFGFTFLDGFAQLFGGGGDPFSAWREFFSVLELYTNRFVEYFYRGLLPFNVGFAGVIAFIIVGTLIYWSRTNSSLNKSITFLLIMLFAHGLLIPFGGASTPFINVGLEAVILILVAVFIIYSFPKNKIWISLFCILIVVSCFNAIIKYNSYGQTVFAIQRGLTLENELAAIDYTYQKSKGEDFSINTITSPLWINTVWSYLYEWYGKDNYQYLPTFHGRNQEGYLSYLKKTTLEPKHYFLIIEPLAGIPTSFVEGTVGYEDSYSKIIEEKQFGGIVVQKRALIKPFKEINFIQ